MLEELDHSENGVVKDEELEALISEYEEKPLLIRALTSNKIEDLKGMSEIPRRLVFAFSNLDVVIEAREELHELLFEQATRHYDDALEMLGEASTMLSDDDEENDADALKLQRSAQMKIKKAERKMRLAIVHKSKTSRLLKRYRLSVLQYMLAVERKGRTEIIEAYTAIAMSEDGEEVKAK